MEELVVTRLWMAGVVGMMAVFGVIALVGWIRHARKQADDQAAEDV